MRWAPPASVPTTTVMRDTPGVSLCPTVSEVMLKLRRRNSDATRLRTPGRSSTYTVNVCMVIDGALSDIRAGFDDGIGPANHRVQIGARRDHRIDRVLLLDTEVHHDRARVRARRGDSREHVGAP